jgi:hypothetical protein
MISLGNGNYIRQRIQYRERELNDKILKKKNRDLSPKQISRAAAAYLHLVNTRGCIHFDVYDMINTMNLSETQKTCDALQICSEFSSIYKKSKLDPSHELDAINHLWTHANNRWIRAQSELKKRHSEIFEGEANSSGAFNATRLELLLAIMKSRNEIRLFSEEKLKLKQTARLLLGEPIKLKISGQRHEFYWMSMCACPQHDEIPVAQ